MLKHYGIEIMQLIIYACLSSGEYVI